MINILELLGILPKSNQDLISPVERYSSAPAPTPTPTPVYNFGANDKPPIPNRLKQYIENTSQIYKIDPSILASLLAQETGGYNYEPKQGESGEKGISQIIPEYHWQEAIGNPKSEEEYGQRLEKDDYYAIAEAGRILRDLLKRSEDYKLALASYNQGNNPDVNSDYVQNILNRIGGGGVR